MVIYNKACIKCKSINVIRIYRDGGWVWRCLDCGNESLHVTRTIKEEIIIYDQK